MQAYLLREEESILIRNLSRIPILQTSCSFWWCFFDGLEDHEARQDLKSIGFGAEVSEKEDRNVGEVLKEVMPEDFIKFGLIPEFIGRRFGRRPTLDSLDEEALIVSEGAWNSLTKQYDKLFELDGVRLEFRMKHLRQLPGNLLRKTGEGLRAIMEHATNGS